jgi:hypothetical protein
MANTYTQIYIHIVFAVQGRQEGFGAFSYSHSQLSTVIRYMKINRSIIDGRAFSEE